MNVILLTVLLTLLGAGLVVFFIWLGVSSWKSIKFRKESVTKEESFYSHIDELHTRIDDLISKMEDERNEFYDNLHDSTSTLWEEFNKVREEIDEELRYVRDDISESSNENLENLRASSQSVTNLESVINSRFDKQFNLIKSLEHDIELLKLHDHPKYKCKEDKKK